MRLYLSTLVIAGSLVSTAQADQNLDRYRKCWANASTAVVDANGMSGRSLSYAVFVANSHCQQVKVEALATNSANVIDWTTEQLIVKLHHAARSVEEAVSRDIPPVDVGTTSSEQQD